MIDGLFITTLWLVNYLSLLYDWWIVYHYTAWLIGYLPIHCKIDGLFTGFRIHFILMRIRTWLRILGSVKKNVDPDRSDLVKATYNLFPVNSFFKFCSPQSYKVKILYLFFYLNFFLSCRHLKSGKPSSLQFL